jgi:hypothetical protein
MPRFLARHREGCWRPPAATSPVHFAYGMACTAAVPKVAPLGIILVIPKVDRAPYNITWGDKSAEWAGLV